MNKQNAFLCPVIFGVILILVGVLIRVPGGVLTTYGSEDGKDTEGYYSFDNKYVTIDEYFNGDSYNYEIGASLVAGKTAGTMVSKSLFIAAGLICICAGLTLFMFYNEGAYGNEKSKLKLKPVAMTTMIESLENTEKKEEIQF